MKLEGYRGPMCNKHVHSTMTRPVSVGLSGSVPLCASTVKLQRRTAYLHTRVCQDTICDLTFVPPKPTPSPENSYRGHCSLVCVRIVLRPADVRDRNFRGTCVWGGGNVHRALRINAVTIILV